MCWWILAIVRIRHCEIPAFAGMVCGEDGMCWWILAIVRIRYCEIPAFAGMVCGRTECIGGFLPIVAGTTL